MKSRYKFDKNSNDSFTQLKNISSRIVRVNDGNKHPIMMITSQNGFVLQSSKYSKFMAGESLNNYTLLKKGELAYNKGSSKLSKYGCVFELHEDSALIPRVYHSFSINSDNDKTFYAIYLNSGKVNRQLRRLITSTARMDGLMNISYDDFVSITVPHPPLSEQKKIAEFFSKIDEKIEVQSNKVEELEKVKHGLLQKIFSRELRFKDKDGKKFDEWEEKILSEVSDVRDGTHDSPKYVDSGYPLITSKNLNSSGTLDYNDISYITQSDFDEINKRSKVDIGDILFGMIGTIGNPVLVNECNFAIKNVALIKEKILLNSYLIYFLKSDFVARQFYLNKSGGNQKFIALGDLRNMLVKFPCINEQKKISDFLSKFDEKIEIEKKILEKWKTVKKGLLQQMFV